MIFSFLKYGLWFGLMAGLGIILGCYIHAGRVNQTTVMSGVAFVREMPYGEHVVGHIETAVFGYMEKKHLENYLEEHQGNIKINPEVLEQHKDLYGQPPLVGEQVPRGGGLAGGDR
jgi:hypothetical protein